MKTYIIKIFIFLSLLISYQGSNIAQSAKKLYKTGKDLSKSGNYEEAIEYYTKSIEADPKYINSYIDRAFALEEVNRPDEAIEDYISLTELLPDEYKWYYKTASLYYKLNKYNQALSYLASAANIENKDAKIYELKMRCNLALRNFINALTDCDKAIELNQSAENYYYRGLIQKNLENYTQSEEDFNKSLKIDPNYTDSHLGLAVIYLKQNKNDEALVSVNNAIIADNKNKDALLLRGQIYRKKSDFSSALNDLSKLLTLYPNDTEILYQRGLTYLENNQFQNAVTDFNKVIIADSKNKSAILKRANSYEKLLKPAEAIKDYEKLLSLKTRDDETDQIYSTAKDRIFELNKEQEPPVISIIQEKQGLENSIAVDEKTDEFQLKIKIIDRSDIIRLAIDNKNIKFNQDSVRTGILFVVNVKNKNKLVIEAEDIYKNKSLKEFKIIRIEKEPPAFEFITPIISDKNEVLVDPLKSDLNIEGHVIDKSKISSIELNGISATFNHDEINPKFIAKLDIKYSEKLEIIIKDIYGNTLNKVYKINRNPAEFVNINPMGITWVVFIENSDYKSFTSFKGPEKDVNMMKNALSKYLINNILHKKNMTRLQMEKFFSSDLRELVRENNVNSVLIWYAGLGKNIKDKSYWIPSDAKRDEESSYYNINSLKASMQAYSKDIMHTLIVTDACETGPSFYMAMRSLPTEKDCNNTKSTKFKSSQVFMSSGYTQENENSDFTKSFANSLSFNSNACISIEKIVMKVSSDVQKNNNKKPKFGKITGFEDENGSFIFIKK